MFEGIKKLFGVGDAATGNTPARERPDSLTVPANLEPWEDRTLAPEERLQAYKVLVLEELKKIETAVLRLEGDVDKQIEIKDSPNTKRWWDEGMWLKGVSAEDFCTEMDRRIDVPVLLGKNFLGAEAWLFGSCAPRNRGAGCLIEHCRATLRAQLKGDLTRV